MALRGVRHSENPGHFGVTEWGSTPPGGVWSDSYAGVQNGTPQYCTPLNGVQCGMIPLHSTLHIPHSTFRTPHSAHCTPRPVFWIGVRSEIWIGVRIWSGNTPICTPIREMLWSAVWSASILTPKISLDWSVDCTPKIIAELECGLHSKKTGVPNTLVRPPSKNHFSCQQQSHPTRVCN